MSSNGLANGFLKRYAKALNSSDLKAIVACWEVPAMVLSDQGAIAMESEKQIHDFFAAAVAAYHRQGLQATQPLSISAQKISPRVTSVEVTWSALDASGKQRSHERSHYLLRLDDTGAPRLRLAASFALP